jgi:hypothetical protein
MFLGIRLEGWLTILAIILGPLLAFEVQRRRDNRRERRERKLTIFRKLMMTLKAPLVPNHVDAINSIQVEFHGKSGADKKVLDAWRLYISHLNLPSNQENNARWLEKKFDLLIELVYEIGQSLGYKNIDKAAIRDNTYLPQGYVDVESENHRVRKEMLEVLDGLRAISVTMVGPVQVQEPLIRAEEIVVPSRPIQATPNALPSAVRRPENS